MLARKASLRAAPQACDDDRAGELARVLRDRAESLTDAFSKFERACLDSGVRLEEAIPGLTELATMFEALSGALEGEAIGTARDDLEAISDELGRASEELSARERALAALVVHNREIGGRIVELHDCIRTISALVFTLKIEAAPMRADGVDMTAFANRLHALAEHARGAISEYQGAHGRLDNELRTACEAQLNFQRRHRDALTSIAAEIRASLETIAERRRRTVVELQGVGARAREIRDRIGECVVALQIGDSTRQRVEHAHAALCRPATLVEGGLSATAEEGQEEALWLVESDPEGFFARLCRLQSLQLTGALDDFAVEIEAISTGLTSLAGQAEALTNGGRELFGAGDSATQSFLENLGQKLAAARTMVDACRRARAVVDRAADSVVATMADLRRRTETLLRIVVDVSIIGTNALLRANRLSDRGKGIGLIAQELRGAGDRIGKGIHALPPALDRVVAQVESLTSGTGGLDSKRLANLDERMNTAIVAFAASGKGMTTALTRLEHEGKAARLVLERAVATLASHEEASPIARAAAEALEALGSGADDAEDRERIDDLFDRWLRPTYTMASERRIHDSFTGHVEIANPAAVAAPASEDADAFLL